MMHRQRHRRADVFNLPGAVIDFQLSKKFCRIGERHVAEQFAQQLHKTLLLFFVQSLPMLAESFLADPENIQVIERRIGNFPVGLNLFGGQAGPIFDFLDFFKQPGHRADRALGAHRTRPA